MKKLDLKDRIERCSVCETIKLPNGNILPKSQYDPLELVRQGYWFSDGFLSKQCLIDQYGEFGRKIAEKEESLPESCSRNIDERLKGLEIIALGHCPKCEKDMVYILDTTEVKDFSYGPFAIYHCKVCGDTVGIELEE